MLRLIAVFVGLGVLFLIPFFIWGDLFDAALTARGVYRLDGVLRSPGLAGRYRTSGFGSGRSDSLYHHHECPRLCVWSGIGGSAGNPRILPLRTAGLLLVPLLWYSGGSPPGWRRATCRDGVDLSANGGMAGSAVEVAAPFSRGGRVHGRTRENAPSHLWVGSRLRVIASGPGLCPDWIPRCVEPPLGPGTECGFAAAPVADRPQVAGVLAITRKCGILNWRRGGVRDLPMGSLGRNPSTRQRFFFAGNGSTPWEEESRAAPQ